MNLDDFQKRVVECNRNAVVSAGAGSGKTTVLARRFLRLIEEGLADVSEILTLTFTRKAAAEMYERIYKLLIKDRDKPAAAAAVSDFDKASISTLDSFCSRIARDCSTGFGIPPFFQTDETAVGRLAEETALDFMLGNSDDPWLQEFIYINGFENVWKNFFVNISLNYLSIGEPKDFDRIFLRQMEAVESGLFEKTELIKTLTAEMIALKTELKGVKNVQEELLRLNFNDPDEFKNGLQLLKLRKPGGRSEKIEFIRCKEIIDELKPAAAAVMELYGTIENKDLIKGLFDLTAEYQQQLFSRKRASGVLGFHDVLTIAVSGLKSDKALRAYYKGLFRYIMIDEFQDNNILQKELLYLLAEKDGEEAEGIPDAAGLNPEKLFFVGDEKQSIYRFRGADVSVFKQLSNELEGAGGISLSLKKNYRSEPQLIDFFNNVFSHVMRDSAEDYQAEFVPLQSRESAVPGAPDITLLYKPYDEAPDEDALSSNESEAYAIADYIENAVGRLDIAGADGPRKACYDDFAMLFRSGTNQKTYEQVFRAKGIPYTVHSVRSLFQEAPVNDIYNLLQICVYPEDRFASAAFLRSPLINLSDLSFAEFMLSGKPVFAEGQEASCVTDEDLDKYKRARELCAEVCDMTDRSPIADIISTIWFKSGYRYLILQDASLHGYLEYYDYLHELAAGFDRRSGSMAEFLDKVRENLGEYKKLDELKILGYSASGVNIMPVHQSKGLEFPVVILANAGNKGVNDKSRALPAYICEEYGLSFNLVSEEGGGGRHNYFYSLGSDESQAKEDAELRRLLYVALTRAEGHLVVSGCHGKNNRKDEKSMLNLFLSAFGYDGVEVDQSSGSLEPYLKIIKDLHWSDREQVKEHGADMNYVFSVYKDIIPKDYHFTADTYSATELNREAAENRTADEVSQQEAATLPSLPFGVDEVISEYELEAEFGTLSHALIEYFVKSREGFNLPDELKQSLLKPFADCCAAEKTERILKAAESISGSFIESELWKKAGKALNIDSELEITSSGERAGEKIYINGVIDLVMEYEDYIQIVDFKTDHRIVPGEYELQMKLYMDAAAEIYSKPVKCSLFYLRDGAEVPVI